MLRPLFLPRGNARVARWRPGDDVYYQRAPSAHWRKAKVVDVIFDTDRTLYRIEIDHKIYLAKENQLGYPAGRRR